MPHVYYDSAKVYKHDGNKNNLRIIEAQIVQKVLKEQRASAKMYWFL